MKRVASLAGIALLALVAVAVPQDAAAVTADLTCAFVGGVCNNTSSFGTLTFTDLGDNVQVVVDLTGPPPGSKILEVILNYNLTAPDGAGLSVTVDAAPSTLTFSPNNVNADGCVDCFDIAVPGNGNLGKFDTATLVFHNSNGVLDVGDFFFVALNSADVVAAVHIGNIGPDGCEGTGCTPGTTGTGSLFAGGKPPVGTPREVVVPEPGTVILLGTGLVGVAAWSRKRFLKGRAS
jgi:PEP-CTERM motif